MAMCKTLVLFSPDPNAHIQSIFESFDWFRRESFAVEDVLALTNKPFFFILIKIQFSLMISNSLTIFDSIFKFINKTVQFRCFPNDCNKNRRKNCRR